MDTEQEIDVTPKMIEAGCEVLRGFDFHRDDPSEAAEEIFKAMLASQDSRQSA